VSHSFATSRQLKPIPPLLSLIGCASGTMYLSDFTELRRQDEGTIAKED
jgi:hypothetical protein